MSAAFEKEINGTKYRIRVMNKTKKSESLQYQEYDKQKNVWSTISFEFSGTPFLNEKYDINVYEGKVTNSLSLSISLNYKIQNDNLDNLTLVNGDREKNKCKDLRELTDLYIDHRRLYKKNSRGGEDPYALYAPYSLKEKEKNGEKVEYETLKVRVPTTFVETGMDPLTAKIKPQTCIAFSKTKKKVLTGYSRSDFWEAIKGQPLYGISTGTYVGKIIPSSGMVTIQAEAATVTLIKYDNNKAAKEQMAAVANKLESMNIFDGNEEEEEKPEEESVITEPGENDLTETASDINDAASFD